MNCEELQLILPLYADDAISESEKLVIDEHLPSCPLCRAALSEYHTIANEIRGFTVTELPQDLGFSIKNVLHEKLDRRPVISVATDRSESFKDKMLHWLVPYSVGTVAASVFTIAFLFVLMSELQTSVSVLEARGREDSQVMLANSNASEVISDLQLPPEFGDVPIAVSPPELNPAGALVALTKSIVRGDMKDEEVVIVADVFGNGLARIAGVVDPPDNDNAMRELEKAFNTNPDSAPFMPTKVNNSSNAVRVVFKIQRVDVGNFE